MGTLSWSDIFIDASQLPFEKLLSCWPGMVGGRLSPIGASAFGDLYFLRPSGEVERLDVLEGGVAVVAQSFGEFQSFMNNPSWQAENLLTFGVSLLVERGLLREPGQFYGFAPHPAFTGAIAWERAMPLDALVWHSICSQALNGAAPAL
jgi:hypothetical protein